VNKLDEFPIVTIAIPVFNRKYCIENVLDSISTQVYPMKKTKLLFVDNYSTDGTFETLQSFVEKEKDAYFEISLLRAKSNIPQARNICLRNMVGDFILFWDSDVLAPDNEAVKRLVEFLLNEKDVAAVGYPYYLEGEQKLDEKIYMMRLSESFTNVPGLGLGFTLIRKDVFDTIGGFNEKMDYSEDTEFFLRVKGAQLKTVADSRTPCKHLKPEVFKHSRGYMATAKKLNYLKYIKYCFGAMPSIYDGFLATGSRTHYFRLIVYLILPFVIVSSFFYWFIAPLYFIPLLAYHIYKAKRNRLYGFISFAYYLLPGVAISYGYVLYKLEGKQSKPQPFKTS
jgi:glycosyltransferase involved in cell wall biosynthesis